MALSARALQYVAASIVREYGDVSPTMARRLRRNVRRNFKVSISEARAEAFVRHYKAMYDYAASALPRYLTPAGPGRYVDWKDIDIPAYTADIQRRYDREPLRVVKAIVWYAGFYEYLK